MDRSEYDVIIGLEIHVQTKTQTKMFCSCPTNYFGDEPNTHVCPVCMGLPGALPVPNKRALELCILMGLATNCDIENEIYFDRKHYFYPDLPKGYQISQYMRPVCSDGYVNIKDIDGNDFRVDIERIHQEEDVAKSSHHTESTTGLEYSLIDYNKSSVPLIEIVTRPVIKSAYQAKEYATRIRQIARYLNISDADMEKGQMRCEPNISVQKKGTWEYKDGKILAVGDNKLNPKVEVKNIGSISAVEKSIEYEIDRLIEQIEEGIEIKQQTRGWNADKGITEFQRYKETADDYRYMPEPDIPVIDITEEDIERISKEMVELPEEKFNRYVNEYGLSDYDAGVLTADRKISKSFEDIKSELEKRGLSHSNASGEGARFTTGPFMNLLNECGQNPTFIYSNKTLTAQKLAELAKARHSKEITQSKELEVLKEAYEKGTDISKNLARIRHEAEQSSGNLESIIEEVINSNEKAVSDYKGGNPATLGFLIGQVMQKTKGTADPNQARSVLMEKLNG